MFLWRILDGSLHDAMSSSTHLQASSIVTFT